ncbi:MAG: WD40 repeat domain-containing protein [Snowella sp.]|nr:WD40 repeat domain-containing protein [Snowella sp.]
MSQSTPENPFQEQDNLIKDTNVGGDLNFAPVQVDNQTVNNITNNHYVSQISSEAQIRSSKLIKGSPYLGLEKFDVEDSDKFFGRDRWIVELTNYLEKENVLLLLGASGSGKSSLIQAGLIPKLKDQWGSQLFNFTFVPDVDPFESFYGCLLTKYKQSDAKTARMVQEDTLIKVVDSLKKEGIQWLIFIDQFEELFTRTPQNEWDVFVNSLIQLIDKKDPTVKVVMTMRADFLDKLGPYPALGRIHDHQSRMLTDMEDRDLRLAIAEPAARNGVTFETGLIDQIIADFKQQAGSLPLLQYTLDLLWKDDGINDDDRVLNIETYEKLGGVTGALEKQADEIFKNPHNEPEKLNEAERKASEQIFIKLIGLEGKEPVSKRQNKSLFCDGATQESALNKLVDNRLLVIQGKGETATVEVAHEALLRSWKVLQALIREKEEILILRTRLEQDAKNWQDFCKKNPSQAEQYDEFLTVTRLNRIIKLINEKSLVDLDSVIVKFIRASREYRQDLQAKDAKRKQREIESELSLANSLGRYALSIFKPESSLDSLIEAIKAGKILQKHKAKDWTVISALLKVLTQGRERNRLVGHENYVGSVSFSPNGQTLASISYKIIKLWNVEKGEELLTLTGHEIFNSVSFSPDGQTLASASDDNTIKLWKAETGEELLILTGHEFGVNGVSFSPDGQTLASASRDKTIKLWKAETGKVLLTLTGHEDYVSSVSFSPDGQTLASASGDNTIKLWKVETGEALLSLTGHESSVTSVSFSPDGQTLASASYDNTIKLWDLNLDSLMAKSCDWVRGYLKNPTAPLSESDRYLCDGIGTQQ